MTKALWIPGADRTSRYFGGANDYPNQFVFDHVDKTLLHSTETRKSGGCPGYLGGANAPQVTINPWAGYRKTWHHFALNRAGRALGNPSSTPVSENKDFVHQVEIIGFSDPVQGRQYGCYLPEMTDEDIDYLVEQLAFMHVEWPHPFTLPSTWPLYKVSSWAAMDAAHMTSSEYDAFRGYLAHLHAPKPSSHGDVALKIQTVMAKLRTKVEGATPPPTVPSKIAYPGHQHANNLPDDTHVRWIQDNLKKRGLYAYSIDGKFGPGTESAVKKFQSLKGLKVDGFVGYATWNALNITTANKV